jgi:hypothetical protein
MMSVRLVLFVLSGLLGAALVVLGLFSTLMGISVALPGLGIVVGGPFILIVGLIFVGCAFWLYPRRKTYR